MHAHYWTEDYLDLLADLGRPDTGGARGLGAGGGAELEARLRLMDRAGIDMQVLSACPQSPYAEDAKKAAEAARFVNDQYAGLAERHLDRFAEPKGYFLFAPTRLISLVSSGGRPDFSAISRSCS